MDFKSVKCFFFFFEKLADLNQAVTQIGFFYRKPPVAASDTMFLK